MNSKALEIAGVSSETPTQCPVSASLPETIRRTHRLHPRNSGTAFPSPQQSNHDQVAAHGAVPRLGASGCRRRYHYDVRRGVPPLGDEPGARDHLHGPGSAGELPFRVVVSHLIKAPPIDDAVAETLQLSEFLNTELVRGGVLKILGDGTVEAIRVHAGAPLGHVPRIMWSATIFR